MKLKYLFMIILILSGCNNSKRTDMGFLDELFKRTKPSKWEWEAGKMYNKTTPGVCRHRVARLAEKMKAAGEKFEIVYGKSEKLGGIGHVWIEYNGKTLDPTQSGDPNMKYKSYRNVYVNQGSKFQDKDADEFISKYKDGRN